MSWTTAAAATPSPSPEDVSMSVATTPTAAAPPKAPRKPNRWVQHLTHWRKDNAELIKREKLGVGECAKRARETYVKST